MPQLSTPDQLNLYFATLKRDDIQALPSGSRFASLPLHQLISQVVSDRFILSGSQLITGDNLVFTRQYRASISRHYYAMYHAARAIVFASHGGDDFERHMILPRNLPSSLEEVLNREAELTNARLLRNQADYDPYPTQQADWEREARDLSIIASDFCKACEDFALENGYI